MLNFDFFSNINILDYIKEMQLSKDRAHNFFLKYQYHILKRKKSWRCPFNGVNRQACHGPVKVVDPPFPMHPGCPLLCVCVCVCVCVRERLPAEGTTYFQYRKLTSLIQQQNTRYKTLLCFLDVYWISC